MLKKCRKLFWGELLENKWKIKFKKSTSTATYKTSNENFTERNSFTECDDFMLKIRGKGSESELVVKFFVLMKKTAIQLINKF